METQPAARRPVPAPQWAYRRRSFSNLLKMGHCAPTVMQTLIDVSAQDGEWLVRLSAGMPGGIGNTGFECGAITSPLVMLGVHDGLRDLDRGLPVIFDKGHALCQEFLARNRTMQCREIRGNDHFPRHCIMPVLRSPELYQDARDGPTRDVIPAATRVGYARLYGHLVDSGFHCAKAVLTDLGIAGAADSELLDTVSAFVGGTLFMGRTCSALTAGVMAMGLQAGQIESSRLRVARMLAIMTVDGNAFDDRLNKFNRSMNRGHRLARWFADEFGSTQCRAITGCDFSVADGVSDYIDQNKVARCRAIGCAVAEQVQQLLA